MIRNKVVYGEPALGVPAHLSLGQHFLDRLKQNCNERNIALINGDNGRTTTYKMLLQEVVNFAAGLKKIGLKHGDVVAILSENKDEYFTAMFGVILCGATITTLNYLYSKDEILHAVSLTKPNMIICSEVAIQRHLSTIKLLSYIKTIIQIDGAVSDGSILSYKNVSIDTDIIQFEPVPVQGATDTAFILYSSGTTGMPKGVMLTHLNVLYIMSSLDCGYTAEHCSRSLIVVPWYHSLGLMYTLTNLLRNKLTVFSHSFSIEKYLNAIEKYKIDVLIAAPPIVITLSKSPLVQKYNTSSVKIIWCGGAPLGSETTSQVLKRMPGCIHINQLYGMTEVTCGVIKDKDTEESKPKSGSCGYPIPGYQVKVVHIETREKLGPYQQGEICLKGCSMMKGYIFNEAASRDIIDEESYIKTGDIGYYDNDGCFFVIDRLKELIKYKGFQVSPAAVEKVILQHDGVLECGVVGRPDELAGELPTAFVVPKPGSNLTPEEILSFTSERLSSSALLRGGVIFIDNIPKNRSGKILRRELRNLLKSYRSSVL